MAESIPYNKKVTLTGTPSIKIDSNEESVDVVQLTETNVEITSISNTALCFELLSVKENIAIISIIASNLSVKTLFTNFVVNGLAINNIPFEIDLSDISLSNNTYNLKVRLNETIPRDTPCVLNGVETARIVADNTTFGPFSSVSNEIISNSFKFGNGKISIIYVQGYSVILKIISSKTDYTKNTEINGLYINNNIPLICKLKDDIEFNEDGTYVECKLSTPINEGIVCHLSYEVDSDSNFETIEIVTPTSVTSDYKYFGDVIIGLKAVDGKNVKINVRTGIQNITTTNNVRINNLFVNGVEIICQFNENIDFVFDGNELNCILNSLGSSETYTLTGNNIEIVSFADRFGKITIDAQNKTVRTSPKNIDRLTISLSSVAGNKASIKLSTSFELYTFLKIFNLRIKRRNLNATYDLNCPKVYIDLTEENSFSDIIICTISSTFGNDLYFSLVDEKDDISIESYDNFEEKIIETNEVRSTKFGDIFINYVDSSIAINISSIYQSNTISNINIYNLMLNSSLILDCSTLDKIEISPKGTVVYCNLKEVNGAQGVNGQHPYILPNSIEDTFTNIILEKKSINLKSANCYAFYNKTSCELNSNCVFAKETYGYCNYKNDYTINAINITLSRDCILYLNKEECNNDDNCLWNEEEKYICKNKEINNCKYLDKYNLNKCGECELGYQLTNEGTCKIYHCIDYAYSNECTSRTNCLYSHSSFYYCSNKEETNNDIQTQSNCHLYLTQNSCNSQEKCKWRYHYYSGCKQRTIDNCIKLRESDESLCEECEEGYNLTSWNTCIKQAIHNENKRCENYDIKSECLNDDYCEYTNRSYCYGGEGCELILNRELCEENTACHWSMNIDSIEHCKLRYIENCLRISPEDYNLCLKCEDGYYLFNSNTLCKKSESEDNSDDYIYHNEHCFEYGGEEKNCLNDERCEFSARSFCESEYNKYDYNVQCSNILNKDDCENNEYCYWNTDSIKTCKIKIVEHCLEMSGGNNSLCLTCENGYFLSNNSTECKKSEGQFIYSSLISLALILLILL